jgi:hypothetical protein
MNRDDAKENCNAQFVRHVPDTSLSRQEQIQAAIRYYDGFLSESMKEFNEIAQRTYAAKTIIELAEVERLANRHEGGFALQDMIIARRKELKG